MRQLDNLDMARGDTESVDRGFDPIPVVSSHDRFYKMVRKPGENTYEITCTNLNPNTISPGDSRFKILGAWKGTWDEIKPNIYPAVDINDIELTLKRDTSKPPEINPIKSDWRQELKPENGDRPR